jgi:hypothetical protein
MGGVHVTIRLDIHHGGLNGDVDTLLLSSCSVLAPVAHISWDIQHRTKEIRQVSMKFLVFRIISGGFCAPVIFRGGTAALLFFLLIRTETVLL